MFRAILVAGLLLAGQAVAQEKSFILEAPQELSDNGFLQYLLPRFSLKTGVRISLGDEGATATLGETGTPVFREGEVFWHLEKEDGPYTDAFEAWLTSDVGKRTIESFKVDGVAVFSSDVSVAVEVVEQEIDGDVVLGEEVALATCGRCHVVNESNRMNAIGSTPSFALMRNFADWRERFDSFYVLKPHAAFTQVEDVTAPFADNLPSPIAPIEVTIEEIEAITAYVASLEPADLGAPIEAGRAFQSP